MDSTEKHQASLAERPGNCHDENAPPNFASQRRHAGRAVSEVGESPLQRRFGEVVLQRSLPKRRTVRPRATEVDEKRLATEVDEKRRATEVDEKRRATEVDERRQRRSVMSDESDGSMAVQDESHTEVVHIANPNDDVAGRNQDDVAGRNQGGHVEGCSQDGAIDRTGPVGEADGPVGEADGSVSEADGSVGEADGDGHVDVSTGRSQPVRSSSMCNSSLRRNLVQGVVKASSDATFHVDPTMSGNKPFVDLRSDVVQSHAAGGDGGGEAADVNAAQADGPDSAGANTANKGSAVVPCAAVAEACGARGRLCAAGASGDAADAGDADGDGRTQGCVGEGCAQRCAANEGLAQGCVAAATHPVDHEVCCAIFFFRLPAFDSADRKPAHGDRRLVCSSSTQHDKTRFNGSVRQHERASVSSLLLRRRVLLPTPTRTRTKVASWRSARTSAATVAS